MTFPTLLSAKVFPRNRTPHSAPCNKRSFNHHCHSLHHTTAQRPRPFSPGNNEGQTRNTATFVTRWETARRGSVFLASGPTHLAPGTPARCLLWHRFSRSCGPARLTHRRPEPHAPRTSARHVRPPTAPSVGWRAAAAAAAPPGVAGAPRSSTLGHRRAAPPAEGQGLAAEAGRRRRQLGGPARTASAQRTT